MGRENPETGRKANRKETEMKAQKFEGYWAIRQRLFRVLVEAQNGKPGGVRFLLASQFLTNACMAASEGQIDDQDLVDGVMAHAPWLSRAAVTEVVMG